MFLCLSGSLKIPKAFSCSSNWIVGPKICSHKTVWIFGYWQVYRMLHLKWIWMLTINQQSNCILFDIGKAKCCGHSAKILGSSGYTLESVWRSLLKNTCHVAKAIFFMLSTFCFLTLCLKWSYITKRIFLFYQLKKAFTVNPP